MEVNKFLSIKNQHRVKKKNQLKLYKTKLKGKKLNLGKSALFMIAEIENNTNVSVPWLAALLPTPA